MLCKKKNLSSMVTKECMLTITSLSKPVFEKCRQQPFNLSIDSCVALHSALYSHARATKPLLNLSVALKHSNKGRYMQRNLAP